MTTWIMTSESLGSGARSSPGVGVCVDVAEPIATLELVGWGRAGPDAGTWRELADALAMLARRGSVECVVLRGAGSASAFGGSARLRAAAGLAGGDAERPPTGDAVAVALRALRGSPQPIIAAIEGACTAWGLEVATCCDVRICGESSRLGAPVEAEWLGGVYGEPRPLAQLLGATPALDAVLGGALLGAEQALALGLVNRVAPDAAVTEHAHGLAARIAAGAPLLNPWHKQVVRRLYGACPFLG